jgi:hypothetical protein
MRDSTSAVSHSHSGLTGFEPRTLLIPRTVKTLSSGTIVVDHRVGRAQLLGRELLGRVARSTMTSLPVCSTDGACTGRGMVRPRIASRGPLQANLTEHLNNQSARVVARDHKAVIRADGMHVGEGVGVGLAVGVGVGFAVGVGVGDGDCVGCTVGVGLGEGVGVGLAVGVGVGRAVGVAVGRAVGVGVGRAVGLGVGLGVAVGRVDGVG